MAHVSCRKEYGTLTLVVHTHYLTSGTIQSIPTRHVNHLEPMKPKPCSFQYHHHFRTGIACEDQGRSRSDRQACTTSSLFLATGFIDYNNVSECSKQYFVVENEKANLTPGIRSMHCHYLRYCTVLYLMGQGPKHERAFWI